MMLPVFMNSAARMNSGSRAAAGFHHAVQQLLGCGAHVDPDRNSQRIEPPIHRQAERHPDDASRPDGDQREGKGAGQVHSPELVLVMSTSSGATPRTAFTIAQA